MGTIVRKFELAPADEKLQSLACRQCCRDTQHKIVANYKEQGSEHIDARNSVDWWVDSQIIQCAGCQEVSFRTLSSNSEDVDYDYEEGQRIFNEVEKFYPGRSTGLKTIESHLLPYRIYQIYQETRAAIEGDLFIVGGIGVRALLDAICKEVDAAGKDLYQKIDDLHAKSLVTKEGTAALHKIRLLGNKSAHEAEAHSREQLSLALEVVEYMLVGTYIIPRKVGVTFQEPERLLVASLPPLST